MFQNASFNTMFFSFNIKYSGRKIDASNLQDYLYKFFSRNEVDNYEPDLLTIHY